MTAVGGLGVNVGAAWVALRFSARGAASQIRRELDGEGAIAGRAMGSSASREFKSNFSKGLAGIGNIAKKAILPVSVAVAAIGYESIKSATTFQASMTKIRTQAGASRAEVNKMSKAVLDMARSSQQGPEQLSEALYHLESLGLRGAKALQALKTASDFAAVSGANLEQTASAIGGAWRTGIVGAKSFTQSAATLNAVVGAGNMRMEDLLGALGTGILPAAKTFGLNLKQVGAAIALFTDEGVPAVDAATRLRMSFSLLGAPSQAADKQLKAIGLTGLQLANAMRGPQGLIGAISLLKDHLDASGLSASKQAALLSRAFGGGRSSSAILSMLNNLDVLKKKQDQVNTSTGKYGAAVKAQAKTAQAQFDLLKSNIESIGTRLGLALLPPVTKFATFLDKYVVPGAVTAGRKITHAFESVIPVKSIENDWHKLLRFLGLQKPKPVKITFPVSARAALAATNPVPRLQDLIHLPAQKTSLPVSVDLLHGGGTPGVFGHGGAKGYATSLASTLGAALSKVNWGQVISTAIGGAGRGATAIGGAILGLFSKINWTDVGTKAAGAMVPFAIGLWNGLGNAIINEGIHHPLDLLAFVASLIPAGKIATVAEKVLGDIPLLGPIVKMFTKPLAAAGRVVEKFFGGVLKAIFGSTAKKVTDLLAGAKTWLVSKGDDIILGLLSGIEKKWPRVASWLLSLVTAKIPAFFKGAALLLFPKGISIITGLLHGMLHWWTQSAFPWLKMLPQRIQDAFARPGNYLLNIGGQIILGLLHGIKAKMLGIASWVKSTIVDPVINAVKSFFGIHSPSTVMAEMGSHLMTGLFKGIMSHDLGGFIKKVFGSFPSALGHLLEKGIVSIGSLPGKALHALGGLAGKIGGFFGHLFGGGGGGGVQQWSGLVSKVLGMLGLPSGYLGPWLSQMMTESGGNPKAINLTDINAQHGDPSRGLLQVIGSTFDQYAGPFRGLGIYNPLANVFAAINYAKHRYGALGMLSVIGHGHGYDQGGIANGLGYLPKYTPKPERVLSPQQTSAFERLVDVLDGRSGGNAKPTRQRVEFDPRTMEMWIRNLATQEAGAEIAFRKR